MCEENRPFVYLATPYSYHHEDPAIEAAVMKERFEIVTKTVGALINQGYKVYSPITHNHLVAEHCALPTTWEFWKEYDRAFISCSSHLFVLQIDGWEESVGVTDERKIAEEMGIPVLFLQPEL